MLFFLLPIDVAMFAGGHCKARIAGVETTEGCPITPGTTLNKVPTYRKTCI